MFYVYVTVERESGKRYIGFTSNLRRRLAEHNGQQGSRYTKSGSWNLIYYEAYLSKKDALRREKALKDGRSKYHLFQRIKYSLTGQK